MDWTATLSVIAIITSFSSQFIGIEICFHIVRNGSTGEMSPVPFVAYFISACLWLKYGLMSNITSVTLTSGLGSLLQFLYICVYYIYSKKKHQVHCILLLGTVILFTPLIYIQYFERDGDVALRNLGLICSGISILCYASPLATLSKVIEHKSTESMSFYLCFINFLCGLQWTLYGVAINDNVVIIPNAFGIILGLIQFYLFCIYGCKNSKTASVLTA
ncbi:sugar transporter SWEET1-like [Physella acuta]|uniref:sugar transporter SWEET1-like n=1 Tax=Physella acuta TaxID=109671 RepID=UPI0027DC1BA1|nr:sugar transporter SWEET1-like [Physella acuta]XP_059159416.1 sugar transporter SWEET1-like [Physella acuta]XP_059159417.1 sugar transporter SWEET1-like [Physella acuta]